jgi:hypothetical protein
MMRGDRLGLTRSREQHAGALFERRPRSSATGLSGGVELMELAVPCAQPCRRKPISFAGIS